MKKNLVALVSILILMVLAGTQTMYAKSKDFKHSVFSSKEMTSVMSFNLRYAETQGAYAWDKRKGIILDVFNEYNPLFVGTQEGLHGQVDYLKQNLPNYDYIGVSRKGNTEDEYSAIFYDKTKATLKDSGTFWLSETPDIPGSISWQDGHPRIATWGEFKVKGNPNRVFVFNTHLSFDHKVTEKQAAILIERMEKIVDQESEVIMTGDFNIPKHSNVWNQFQDAGFMDAWDMAKHESGPEFTSHGFKGLEAEGQSRIDWVLYRNPGVKIENDERFLAEVVTYNKDGLYPSDHFPVVFTTLGRPDITAGNLQISRTEVEADESFTVSADIRNEGKRGMSEAVLYIDGKAVVSKWVVLDKGETQSVTFNKKLYKPGKHDITIHNIPPQTVNVEAKPATMLLSQYKVEPYVTSGQGIPVTAVVRNSGSFDGTFEANLTVNGEVVQSKRITVPSGESRTIEFSHTFNELGSYTVALASQSVIVNVMQDISGQWLFKRGDDMAWKEPGLDETGWETVVLPMSWEKHSGYEQDYVFGWYRKTITVPAEWAGKPVKIMLGRIDDAEMSYFNGQKIGQTGSFPEDPNGFFSKWGDVREYVIQPENIHYGAENQISIRVYDDLGGGGLHGGPLGILPVKKP